MSPIQTTTDPPTFNLDHPLVKFSQNPKDWWTIRDAVRGVQIFGGIGSGKSSGSGKTIAKIYLKNGFGGLVLCAKPDEKDNWIQYARETGREDDLIIFSKGSEYEFNPLHYEMTREGEGAGEVFNLSYLFMEIYKMGNRFSGGGGTGGGDGERFWEAALQRCINRVIELIRLSGEELSIKNMQKILSSVPTEEQVEAMPEMKEEDLGNWAKISYCVDCMEKAGGNAIDEETKDLYEYLYDFFFNQFARMGERVRSTIVESFLGLAEPFSHGILKKHFSKGTNLNPELTHEGKIIILDFPVKEFLASGVYAQGIFKLLWQQATERRKINKFSLPVFLWADESQLFISDYDQIFQTTARSSKACTVLISQNISNYYSAIGGRNPRPKVDSLLGNLGTKIFHANNDSVTNEWAANTIGKAFINISGISVGKEQSSSLNQHLHYLIEPREFTVLASGGEENDCKVEGIVTVSGKSWSDETNFRKAIFKQNI